jgi:SNF2 family DNA or RNA helicase
MEALKFLYPRNFGALYTDMGSGKTKIMIDLIVNRGFKRTLIVAPKKVCSVWPTQFQAHAPNEPIKVIDVSNTPTKSKAGKVLENVSASHSHQIVIVVNYDSIWREPFKKFILNFPLDAVICDESHRIKSPGSKCSRMLSQLGKRVENRFLMTGTPLAQSPLDIYAQYRFLQPKIFGTNFYAFRERYANMILLPNGVPILDKRNPYKNQDELHEKMFSCAFKMDVEHSLPETQDIFVEFELSPKAQKYYQQMKKEGALELKQGDVAAGNVLAIITRLQQIVSGYLPVIDEDNKTKIVNIDDSRRIALKELIEDIPPDEPIVIFAKYRKDIKDIIAMLEDMGRTSSELSGRADTLKDWLKGKAQILVVQISSGAEGIDLTRAKYNIYYTPTHSLSQYLQSRKRTHRPGQTRPVVYYKLVAKLKKGKSIDEIIYHNLDRNQEVIDYIMQEGTL